MVPEWLHRHVGALVPQNRRAIAAPTGGGTEGEFRDLTKAALPRAVRRRLPDLADAKGLPGALAAIFEATRSQGTLCRLSFRRGPPARVLFDLDGTLVSKDSSVGVTALLASPEASRGVFADDERVRLQENLDHLIRVGLVSEDDLRPFGYRPAQLHTTAKAAAATDVPTKPSQPWGWVEWYAATKDIFASARKRDATALELAVRTAVADPPFQAMVYEPMRTALQLLQRRSQIVVVSGALHPVPEAVCDSLLTPKHPVHEFLSDLGAALFRKPRTAIVIGAGSERPEEPFGQGKAPRVRTAINEAQQVGTRVAAVVVDRATGDGPAILEAITPAMHEVQGQTLLRVPVIVIVNADDEMRTFLRENDATLRAWTSAGGQLHHVTIPSPSPGS